MSRAPHPAGEDLSPAALPFTSALNERLADPDTYNQACRAAVVYESVDFAKRMLLQLRVRDFTAADVVALAALIEARDRSAA